MTIFQSVSDAAAGLAGHGEGKPVRAGAGALAGDDFDALAAFQLLRKRRQNPIYAAGHAVVADVRMHGVGEVHRAGALGQLQNVALGRKDIDVVREKVALEVLNELQRIAGALLQIHHILDPAPSTQAAPRLLLLLLVQPMAGDAVVRHFRHVLGADLHLDGHPVHAEQGGVQGLVAVDLGDGDVVLEATGDRLVEIVDHPQGPVAGVLPIHNDAEAEHVHDFLERLVLGLHLLVDRVQVLLAAFHLRADALSGKGFLDGSVDFVHQRLAVASGRLDGVVNALRPQRVQRSEAQVLQLHVDVVHAQAIGDGRVVVQGLPGNAPPLLPAEHAYGAHVVQAVGDLDHDDANVLRHRQHHFLEVDRLGFGVAVENGRQLGHAIDQLRHLLPETHAQGALDGGRVLNGVVQQGGHERFMVHAHLRKDRRHRQRVGDVFVPGLPPLAGVGALGVPVGAAHRLNLLGSQVLAQQFAERPHSPRCGNVVPSGPCGQAGNQIGLRGR